MNFLLKVQAVKNEKSLTIDQAVTKILLDYREKNKKVPGFGHRVHTQDPRSIRLFALAEEYGIAGEFVQIARSVVGSLKKVLGKELPINVDGAIATLLCELNFPPALANAFFIMARLPGLVAHVYEEQTRQKPMRKIHPSDHEYDGAEDRKLP